MREASHHLTRATVIPDLSTGPWSKLQRMFLDHGPFLLVAAGLAMLWFLGRWAGAYPFPYLWGDASNLVSFVVARDHPGLFLGDPAVGDLHNFRVYWTVHIPIISSLAKVTGDYGTAFISLLGVHVFVQALGFYLLGLVVFQSRYWSALFAALSLMPIPINLGEFWGASEDPLPRFTFQAILPFLLAGSIFWRRQVSAWPVLIGLAGLLIYVHPISAPLWAFAIWLGIWPFHPASWSREKRFGYMALLGAIFVAVVFPFLLHYLRNFAQGVPDDATYRHVYGLIDSYLGPGFLDVSRALKDFLTAMVWPPRVAYWILAVVGTVLIVQFRPHTRDKVLLGGLWTTGLLAGAVAVPWIERVIARAYETMPLEFDLVRGIRYFIPITLLFFVWPFAEFARGVKRGRQRAVWIGVGTALVVTWAVLHPPLMVLRTAYCWAHAALVCKPQAWTGTAEVLQAVQQLTPPGSKILPTSSLSKASMSSRIRFYAVRPVVHSWRDGALFTYGGRARLVRWFEREQKLQELEAERNPTAKLQGLVNLTKQLGASYLVVDFPVDLHLARAVGADVLWARSWERSSPLSGQKRVSYGLLRIPTGADAEVLRLRSASPR